MLYIESAKKEGIGDYEIKEVVLVGALVRFDQH